MHDTRTYLVWCTHNGTLSTGDLFNDEQIFDFNSVDDGDVRPLPNHDCLFTLLVFHPVGLAHEKSFLYS
ncbi:MAG TPA: hypothetical protein DEF45_10235, partial [Rhodopirellula sp.]|nr:hypothetical protein [Rhodopirellula sp.]